jgi:mono/diheme cytochrome c family protein
MHAVGDAEPVSTDGTAPVLTGYGGVEWIKHFVSNPAAPECYGEKNAMPAFGERLTPDEIELLARWMAGDYVK